MYSEAWAREILAKYLSLCTRAQQMNLAIVQVLVAQGFSKCTPHIINACLIDSIRKAKGQKLWTLYKRLNKRTPLDLDLLNQVCEALIRQGVAERIADNLQMCLTFV